MITFCYCLIFLVDFVSKWFKHYSIYLAGERTDVVSNPAELRMLKLAQSMPVDLCIYNMSNNWLAIQYAYKFPHIFGHLFDIMKHGEALGLTGLGFKVFINVIELK